MAPVDRSFISDIGECFRLISSFDYRQIISICLMCWSCFHSEIKKLEVSVSMYKEQSCLSSHPSGTNIRSRQQIENHNSYGHGVMDATSLISQLAHDELRLRICIYKSKCAFRENLGTYLCGNLPRKKRGIKLHVYGFASTQACHCQLCIDYSCCSAA